MSTTGDADVAAVAALIADPARAAMLDALMDGRSCRAGELAARAGIAPSTASGHLSRLLAGGLVAVEPRGRERLYRLGSPAVATALEALSRVAPAQAVLTLRSADRGAAIRAARTCYDHLAGRLGVDLTEALVRDDALVLRDTSYELTTRGAETMASSAWTSGPHERGTAPSRARASTGASAVRTSPARSARRWPTRCSRTAGSGGARTTGR